VLADFDRIAERLAGAGFRVLRPQPRGIGESRGPMSGIDLHDYAADVAAIIAHDGGSAALVVGHAFGNRVARMLATIVPTWCVPWCSSPPMWPCAEPARGARGHPGERRSGAARRERLAALQFAFFAPATTPHAWPMAGTRDVLARNGAGDPYRAHRGLTLPERHRSFTAAGSRSARPCGGR